MRATHAHILVQLFYIYWHESVAGKKYGRNAERHKKNRQNNNRHTHTHTVIYKILKHKLGYNTRVFFISIYMLTHNFHINALHQKHVDGNLRVPKC